MRKSYLLCFVLLANISFGQVRERTTKIIETNDSLIKDVIKNSEKEYHLLILYVDWCKPCRDSLPSLFQVLYEYPSLESYFIYVDKTSYINLLSKYLEKNPGIKQSYILDNSYTGNVKKRLIKFRNQFCDNCSEVEGLPSVILINKDYEVLFKRSGTDHNFLRNYLKLLLAE